MKKWFRNQIVKVPVKRCTFLSVREKEKEGSKRKMGGTFLPS